MYQPDPTLSPHRGALCATHPERPAATICTRCGSYACDVCLRVGNDRQDYCFRCVPLTQQLADPGTRLVAELVDRFAIILPVLGAGVLGAMLGAAMGRDEGSILAALLMLLGGLGSFGVLGYQLYLVATTSQSLGKRMMGIQVLRTDGSPIDVGRLILLRNVVPALINSATCGLFGIVDALIIFTADRRCLHDHIADTKVVVVNKPTR